MYRFSYWEHNKGKFMNKILIIWFGMALLFLNKGVAQQTTQIVRSQALVQEYKIQENNTVYGDFYGAKVVIDGDAMLVGAAFKGKGDAMMSYGKGAVYAYRRNAGSWVLEDIIESNDTEYLFGAEIALKQNRALISAPRDNAGKGKVLAFEYNNGQWQQTQIINPPNPTISGPDSFGGKIIMDGTTAFVTEQYSSTDDYRSGRVFVYKYSNGVWNLSQELKANPFGSYTYFGTSIALKDGRLFVGSYDFLNLGKVWVLEEVNGQWQHVSEIIADSAELSDYFSSSILPLSKNRLVVSTLKDKASNGNKSGSFSIYDYNENSQTWQLLERVFPPINNPSPSMSFASNVVSQGNDLYVTALLDDEIKINSGAIYHYRVVGNTVTFKGIIKMNQVKSRSYFAARIFIDGNDFWVSTPKDTGGGSVIKFVSDYIFSDGME